MTIEIELPYYNLEKAFEKATEQAVVKIEDAAYESDNYRTVCSLRIEHIKTEYFMDKFREHNSCYTFTFEVTE